MGELGEGENDFPVSVNRLSSLSRNTEHTHMFFNFKAGQSDPSIAFFQWSKNHTAKNENHMVIKKVKFTCFLRNSIVPIWILYDSYG